MKSLRIILQCLFLALFSLGVSISAQADEKVTYLHTDIFNSVVAASDENNQVLWHRDHQPYGKTIDISGDSSDEDIAFTGKHIEQDTGLINFGRRWYDPEIGRFVSIDPVRYYEGNIHSFNRYAYANNNPYKYVDPDGRFSVEATYFATTRTYKYTFRFHDNSHVAKDIATVGLSRTYNAVKKGLGALVTGADKTIDAIDGETTGTTIDDFSLTAFNSKKEFKALDSAMEDLYNEVNPSGDSLSRETAELFLKKARRSEGELGETFKILYGNSDEDLNELLDSSHLNSRKGLGKTFIENGNKANQEFIDERIEKGGG